jgi:Zn-dependent alcohol dehydrogenase
MTTSTPAGVLTGLNQDWQVLDVEIDDPNPWEVEVEMAYVYGSSSPRVQVPNLLRLHARGVIDLDDFVTQEYTLDEVERGYQDMLDGHNVRGVIRF